MKPILILNLGGTICMSKTDSGLKPDPEVLPVFLKKHYPSLDYSYSEPFELIDSSQANYEYWYEAAKYLNEQAHLYRGVIITHGTDTMAYFASALRFFIKSQSLPIIITGSQLPLTQTGNDAISNVDFSISAIDDSVILNMGIAIAFNNQLFQAEKTSKINTQSLDGFAQNHPTPSKLSSLIQKQDTLRDFSLKSIEIIWFYPSFDYTTLPKVKSNHIYILKSYGAGTINKHPSIEYFLQSALDKQALVINHSQCFYSEVNMDIYEAGSWLTQYNVVSGQKLVLEALLAKLHCIEKTDINSIKRELLTPYHLELA